MPKYVEVESTKEFASTFLNDIFFRMAVNRTLDAAPAADVAEVVRCKDCKHYCSFYNECDEEHNHYTEEGFREVYDNDFCSYGERKTDD